MANISIQRRMLETSKDANNHGEMLETSYDANYSIRGKLETPQDSNYSTGGLHETSYTPPKGCQ